MSTNIKTLFRDKVVSHLKKCRRKSDDIPSIKVIGYNIASRVVQKQLKFFVFDTIRLTKDDTLEFRTDEDRHVWMSENDLARISVEHICSVCVDCNRHTFGY